MMKGRNWIIFLLTSLLMLSSCATGINPKQKLAYDIYREKGLLVESRNPDEASSFGFLPGGASFYNGDYDVGAFNILLWPVSSIWEVANGGDRAKLLNLKETEKRVLKDFKKEVAKLDDLNYLDEISSAEYNKRFRELFKKYNNTHSHILSKYRSIAMVDYIDDTSSSGGLDNSLLSKVDQKIQYTCDKEYKTLKRELSVIDKDHFMSKCAIKKRKAFIGLGL